MDSSLSDKEQKILYKKNKQFALIDLLNQSEDDYDQQDQEDKLEYPLNEQKQLQQQQSFKKKSLEFELNNKLENNSYDQQVKDLQSDIQEQEQKNRSLLKQQKEQEEEEQKNQNEQQLIPDSSFIMKNGALNPNFTEELSCSICLLLPIEPYSCIQCVALYCKGCIQSYIKQQCPVCNQPHTNQSPFTFPNHILGKMLSFISTNCENMKFGCPEKIKCSSKDIQEHLQVCKFKLMKCKYNKCKQILEQDQYEQHIELECQYRSYQCENCQQEILLVEKDEHSQICVKVYTCDQCNMQYVNKEQHEQECSFQLIECENCKQKLTLQQLEQHDETQCQQNKEDNLEIRPRTSLVFQGINQQQKNNKRYDSPVFGFQPQKSLQSEKFQFQDGLLKKRDFKAPKIKNKLLNKDNLNQFRQNSIVNKPSIQRWQDQKFQEIEEIEENYLHQKFPSSKLKKFIEDEKIPVFGIDKQNQLKQIGEKNLFGFNQKQQNQEFQPICEKEQEVFFKDIGDSGINLNLYFFFKQKQELFKEEQDDLQEEQKQDYEELQLINNLKQQLRDLILLNPESYVLKTNLAYLEFRSKNYYVAVDLCNDVLDKEPAFLSAYYRLSQIYDQLENFEELKKTYINILNLQKSQKYREKLNILENQKYNKNFQNQEFKVNNKKNKKQNCIIF